MVDEPQRCLDTVQRVENALITHHESAWPLFRLDLLETKALCYRENNELQRARKIQEYIVLNRIEDDSDVDAIIRGIRMLVEIYSRLGRYQKAVGYGEEVFELQKKVFGEAHPETLSLALILAEAYLALGQTTRSIDSYEWLVSHFCEDVLDPTMAIIRTLQHACRALYKLGQREKAREVAEILMVTNRNVVGPVDIRIQLYEAMIRNLGSFVERYAKLETAPLVLTALEELQTFDQLVKDALGTSRHATNQELISNMIGLFIWTLMKNYVSPTSTVDLGAFLEELKTQELWLIELACFWVKPGEDLDALDDTGSQGEEQPEA